MHNRQCVCNLAHPHRSSDRSIPRLALDIMQRMLHNQNTDLLKSRTGGLELCPYLLEHDLIHGIFVLDENTPMKILV